MLVFSYMVDNEILEDFKKESKLLLEEMKDILENIEGDYSQVLELEKYGQTVDRIMGGAKSLATNFAEDFPKDHFIHSLGDYAALCKAVGYKASQIVENEPFYNICVALLMDATDMLEIMLTKLGLVNELPISSVLSKTFLDRLRWVSNQFGAEVRSTVATPKDKAKKMSQTEIDDLLKKLGI